MQLNFYHKRSSSCPTSKTHFFYYPKKETPIVFPKDLPCEIKPIWPLDYEKPLERDHVVEVLKQAYFNGACAGEDMFYHPYFFDPIHGYCKCHHIVNNYKKHLHEARLCDCMVELEFGGTRNLFEICSIKHGEAIAKWGPFQKGFQRVLYVEPMMIFDCQMYIVCSVNVMDVKPIKENTYDIGISYDFVHNWFSRRNLSNYPTPQSRLGYLKGLAFDRFQHDINSYKDECIFLIKDWLSLGFLPQDQYYVHIFNWKTNSQVCEDRFYISMSDYEDCQSFFKSSENQK